MKTVRSLILEFLAKLHKRKKLVKFREIDSYVFEYFHNFPLRPIPPRHTTRARISEMLRTGESSRPLFKTEERGVYAVNHDAARVAYKELSR